MAEGFLSLLPDLLLSAGFAEPVTWQSAAAIGLANGLITLKFGIPSFIMTLAMMQIADGMSALFVRGQIAYPTTEPVTGAPGPATTSLTRAGSPSTTGRTSPAAAVAGGS